MCGQHWPLLSGGECKWRLETQWNVKSGNVWEKHKTAKLVLLAYYSRKFQVNFETLWNKANYGWHIVMLVLGFQTYHWQPWQGAKYESYSGPNLVIKPLIWDHWMSAVSTSRCWDWHQAGHDQDRLHWVLVPETLPSSQPTHCETGTSVIMTKEI